MIFFRSGMERSSQLPLEVISLKLLWLVFLLYEEIVYISFFSHSSWSFFFFNFIGVMTTQVSHLKELTKIYLNRMPFKLFFKKQFSTVDLETNKSVLASTISD